MARCSDGCYNDACTDATVCAGSRLIKLEAEVAFLRDRAQNGSVRQAEQRDALDALAEQLEMTRADFAAALIAFRRQLAPMPVPIVRKKV